MLFNYQTGYIMWHFRLRIYIPRPIKNGQSRETGKIGYTRLWLHQHPNPASTSLKEWTLRITPQGRFSEDVKFLPSIDVMLTLLTINVICVFFAYCVLHVQIPIWKPRQAWVLQRYRWTHKTLFRRSLINRPIQNYRNTRWYNTFIHQENLRHICWTEISFIYT
jgi:hypothetical protein